MSNPLRELRTNAGLTQAEVAEQVTLAGIPLGQPLLSQLERESIRATPKLRSAIEAAIHDLCLRRLAATTQKLRFRKPEVCEVAK